MSSAFAPVWGFGIYILVARTNNRQTLTEGVAFTALSFFELQDQPLISIMDGIEKVQTVVNSFARIQEYLLSEEREDTRLTPTQPGHSSNCSFSTLPGEGIELKRSTHPHLAIHSGEPEAAIILQDASAGYSEGNIVLKGLNLKVPSNRIMMIVGPVGAGKSTFLKLLLGEMPKTSGLVATTFSKAAFCPQTPWITWGTIRQNILGTSAWDKPWYDTVVHACALSADFQGLPQGDQTDTGTRGSRLSGGQQIRVVSYQAGIGGFHTKSYLVIRSGTIFEESSYDP